MKDRGSTCKFRIERSAFAKFTRGSAVFHYTIRTKQVVCNPYINPFLAMKYQFLIHNRVVFRTAAAAAVSYVKGTV